MSLFEQATKQRLRFASTRGQLTTEDLWSLPLEHSTGLDLDSIAKEVFAELQTATETSFVKKAKSTTKIELKLEIVKHIISVKQDEAEARINASDKRERNELIMDVIAAKEIDELKGKSVKALKKELEK